jgi:hypothetical protein
VLTGLLNRPTFPSQEWIDRFRANQLLENHQHPYGPKLPGKHSATVITPKPHLAEGHCIQSWLRKPMVEFVKQKLSWNMAIPCILFRLSSIFIHFIEPSRGLSCLCSVKAPFSASHHVCTSFLLFDAYQTPWHSGHPSASLISGLFL